MSVRICVAGVQVCVCVRSRGCACGCACGLMYPYRCVQINVACFVVLEDACCSHRFRYASRREPTLHLQCARRQRKSERCHECSKSRAYLGKSSAASTATREAHWICVGGGVGGRTVTLLFATRSLSPAAARTSPSVSCTLFILAQFGIKTVGEVNVRCTIYSKVHASIQQLHV